MNSLCLLEAAGLASIVDGQRVRLLDMIDIIFECNDNRNKEMIIKKVEGKDSKKFRVGIYDYDADQEQYIVLNAEQLESLADSCNQNL